MKFARSRGAFKIRKHLSNQTSSYSAAQSLSNFGRLIYIYYMYLLNNYIYTNRSHICLLKLMQIFHSYKTSV